mmetsp:Transcript_43174/g.82334  ORF Transcript_43174/g.82334 Transcript_43174/m.82334 type:complete len:166 (+) Transcript_43174:1315-1812(+)
MSAISKEANLDLAEEHSIPVAKAQESPSPKQAVQPNMSDGSPAQPLPQDKAGPPEEACVVPSPATDGPDGMLLAPSGAAPVRWAPTAIPKEISSDNTWSTPARETNSLEVASVAAPTQHFNNDEEITLKGVGAASDVASTYSTGKLSTDAASVSSGGFESAVEEI